MDRVVIKDGKICCPSCRHVTLVAQNRGIGASYAKKFWKLTPFHINFLTWWIASDYRLGMYEKTFLRNEFVALTGTHVSDDSFNARMSELLSAGTDYGGESLVSRTTGVKSDPRQTTSMPLYQLSVRRVHSVLNDGGVLE
jgi:hypothetical protein